jgi:hexosaminidase
MKRLFLLALTACLLTTAATAQLRIVPQPVEVKTGEGFFRLSPSAAIGLAGNNAEATRVANMLSKKLSTVTGYTVPVTGGAINMGTSNIILCLNTTANATLGSEGYQLKVGTAGAQITANTAAGLFYGMQTFLQLLPAEVEGGEPGVEGAGSRNYRLPQVWMEGIDAGCVPPLFHQRRSKALYR